MHWWEVSLWQVFGSAGPGQLVAPVPAQRFPPFEDEGRRRWEAPSSSASKLCLFVLAFRSA